MDRQVAFDRWHSGVWERGLVAFATADPKVKSLLQLAFLAGWNEGMGETIDAFQRFGYELRKRAK